MTKNLTPLLVVAAALGDQTGRWLMHRRPDNKQHGGLWEFPGGKVEEGESPRAALAREIREEAGLEVDPGDFVEAGFAAADGGNGSGGGIVILLYTAERWSGTLEAREGGLFDWFDHAGIAALDKPPLDVVLARQLGQKRL